jgi:hypothetical protein
MGLCLSGEDTNECAEHDEFERPVGEVDRTGTGTMPVRGDEQANHQAGRQNTAQYHGGHLYPD